MHLSADDYYALARQGDLINHVRAQAGLRISRAKSPEQARRCTRCLAGEGQPCTTGRGRIRSEVHEERLTPAPAADRRPGSWPTPKRTT